MINAFRFWFIQKISFSPFVSAISSRSWLFCRGCYAFFPTGRSEASFFIFMTGFHETESIPLHSVQSSPTFFFLISPFSFRPLFPSIALVSSEQLS